MFCSRCGTELAADDIFCRKCGLSATPQPSKGPPRSSRGPLIGLGIVLALLLIVTVTILVIHHSRTCVTTHYTDFTGNATSVTKCH